MSQQQQPKEVSYQEYVGSKRNQIVLAYDQAKEIALRNFDDMAQKLAEAMSQNAKDNAPPAPTPEVAPRVETKTRKK